MVLCRSVSKKYLANKFHEVIVNHFPIFISFFREQVWAFLTYGYTVFYRSFQIFEPSVGTMPPVATQNLCLQSSSWTSAPLPSTFHIPFFQLCLHTSYTPVYIYIIAHKTMNQDSVKRIQGLKHDRRCSPHRKMPSLSMPQSFLPRPLSPTKHADALQLAWDILNDKVSLPCLNQSKKQCDSNNNNHNGSSDDATDSTDHSSSSLL